MRCNSGSRRITVASEAETIALAADITRYAVLSSEIAAKINSELALLDHPERMLQMYANRGNAKFVEDHKWTNPEVFNLGLLPSVAGAWPVTQVVAAHYFQL